MWYEHLLLDVVSDTYILLPHFVVNMQVKKEVEAERERRVSDKGDSDDAKARAVTYDKLVLVQEQLLSTICQMKVHDTR